MAIKIDTLRDELLGFLEKKPNGKEQEFIQAVVIKGLGTEEEITKFVQCLLKEMERAGVIEDATWVSMITKLQGWISNESEIGAGFLKFKNVVFERYKQAHLLPEMKLLVDQSQLAEFDQILTDAQQKEQVLLPGIQWIKDNMPDGPEKTEVLKALARGKLEEIDAWISNITLAKARLLDEMGG